MGLFRVSAANMALGANYNPASDLVVWIARSRISARKISASLKNGRLFPRDCCLSLFKVMQLCSSISVAKIVRNPAASKPKSSPPPPEKRETTSSGSDLSLRTLRSSLTSCNTFFSLSPLRIYVGF